MLYIACAVLWLLRFALGASIFSFLGVVIWRLPRGESVHPREGFLARGARRRSSFSPVRG